MDGSTVYRTIDKPVVDQPNQNQMQMVNQFTGEMIEPGKPGPSPPGRRSGPEANGFKLSCGARGPSFDIPSSTRNPSSTAATPPDRSSWGANDIAGVKLFASNRNGGDAIEVILLRLSIRADRVTGLGTEIRTVFGEPVHGEPTSIEDGKLIVGGQPKQPPPNPAAPAAGPSNTPQPTTTVAAQPAVAVAPVAPPGVVMVAAAPAVAVAAPAPPPANTPAPAPPPAAAAPAQPPAGNPPAQAVGQVPNVVNVPAFAETPAFQEPAPASGKGGAGAANANANTAQPKPPEPRARIPLDEVESIAFERAFNLSGRYVGQPNLDFTMPGLSAEKEGDKKTVPKTDDVNAPPPGTAAVVKIPKLEPKPNGIRRA